MIHKSRDRKNRSVFVVFQEQQEVPVDKQVRPREEEDGVSMSRDQQPLTGGVVIMMLHTCVVLFPQYLGVYPMTLSVLDK